jgi:xanthine dehydrogenase accessory factor
MAGVVVAVGPGFTAGIDVDAVVETNRGHDLGRVLLEGRAEPDTGMPGAIYGATSQRVLHAPAPGRFVAVCAIGDLVATGDVVAVVEGERRAEIRAGLDGVVRGLLRTGLEVPKGFKVGDIDPRGKREHCFTISDKARAVGGGVLEALLMLGGLPGG